MSTNFVELLLTCGDQQEAQKIADSLLRQKLVSCVKFTEVKSQFRWKDEIETSDEIKLSMTTIAENFNKIETEIAKLHSYETFVLQQVPIIRLNQTATDWLTGETNSSQ